MRLPKFSRALVVVYPHGGWIAEGKKTHLIKSRRYKMWDEPLLMVQKKVALAIVQVGEPREVSLAQFKKLRSHHLVSESERLKWWKGKQTFYYYPITYVKKLKFPVPVAYPQGPQVFVRRQNVKISRRKI